MPVLKEEPEVPIASLSELMSVARGIEQNASRRYTAMSDFMHSRGRADLARMFQELAEEEGRHVEAVEYWARQETGLVPAADPTAGPQALSDHDAEEELIRSNLITPYRILSMAVRSEERAFATWAYIAAQAGIPEVREAAERMAHEELEHADRLRRARRLAYRSEGRHRLPRQAVAITQRLAQAAAAERTLADQIAALADLGGAAAADLGAVAEEARRTARELDRMSGGRSAEVEPGGTTTATAERLLDTYLDICDRSRDEDVVQRVQDIARGALARLGRLQRIMPKEWPIQRP